MKLLGGEWSKGDVIALIGVVLAAIALIPLIPHSIPTKFVGTWYGILNDKSTGSKGNITVVFTVEKNGNVSVYDRDHNETRSASATYKDSILSCTVDFPSRGPRDMQLSTGGDGLRVRVLRVPKIDGDGPDVVFDDVLTRQR